MLSSLILSTLTLMAAGVPAAHYERFGSRKAPDAVWRRYGLRGRCC